MKIAPKAQFGRMYFDDGPRPVLLYPVERHYWAMLIDSNEISRRLVIFPDAEKYFLPYATAATETGLQEIQVVAKVMLTNSRFTGLPREMTKPTRRFLEEILELKNEPAK